jgi:hypothetical protein
MKHYLTLLKIKLISRWPERILSIIVGILVWLALREMRGDR